MGCDIHSFAERKNTITNQWEVVKDYFTVDDYYKEYIEKDKGDNPFYWRNYSMFAVLANVRNNGDFKEISTPKGIPYDISDDVKSYYDSVAKESHSPSYLTLKELLEFNYNKLPSTLDYIIRYLGINPANNIMAHDIISHVHTMNIKDEIKEETISLIIEYSNEDGTLITYKDELGEMFFQHLEELKTLGKPDDVRVIFWFDN